MWLNKETCYLKHAEAPDAGPGCDRNAVSASALQPPTLRAEGRSLETAGDTPTRNAGDAFCSALTNPWCTEAAKPSESDLRGSLRGSKWFQIPTTKTTQTHADTFRLHAFHI